nr:hypothetical protein [Endozoicomonas sp.]
MQIQQTLQIVGFSRYPLTGKSFGKINPGEIKVKISPNVSSLIHSNNGNPSCKRCVSSLLRDKSVYIFECQHIYCGDCARATASTERGYPNILTCPVCAKTESPMIKIMKLGLAENKLEIIGNSCASLTVLEEKLPVRCVGDKCTEIMGFKALLEHCIRTGHGITATNSLSGSSDSSQLKKKKSGLVAKQRGYPSSEKPEHSVKKGRVMDCNDQLTMPMPNKNIPTNSISMFSLGACAKNEPPIFPKCAIMTCHLDCERLKKSFLVSVFDKEYPNNYKIHVLDDPFRPKKELEAEFLHYCSTKSKIIFFFMGANFIHRYSQYEGTELEDDEPFCQKLYKVGMKPFCAGHCFQEFVYDQVETNKEDLPSNNFDSGYSEVNSEKWTESLKSLFESHHYLSITD